MMLNIPAEGAHQSDVIQQSQNQTIAYCDEAL